nr:hypothetical protein [Tanacetum cinerariifolium]
MVAGQRKTQGQWTADERKAANLDQRLKSLIMSHKLELRPTKDFEAKDNKVKAKLALLSLSASASKSSTVKNNGLIAEAYEWDEEEVSSNDNEMVEVKVLMALAEDNDAVSKKGARNSEWVKISMRKKILGVDELTEDPYSSGQKNLVFVKSLADDTKVSIPGVERPWLSNVEGFILPNHDTGRLLPAESQRNTTDPSVVVTDSSATDYDSTNESLVCSTPLPLLKKLDGAEPISGPKIIKSILRSRSTFKVETLKGVIINEPSSALAKDNKSSSASKVNSAPASKLTSVKIKDDPPLAITEKVRLEIEERRKRNSRRIMAAVEEGISKRLRAKEEEIMKIAKLNWALEEKVKSLCVENQIWRELAQTNEATANTLRNNLKQVLEQVIATNNNNNGATNYADADDVAEDAQSCCESNNNQENVNDECSSSGFNTNRLCKKCGKDEACVLLLPCRHLCLCTGCGSSENVCPVCKSVKNISVHVNMS